jgi:hypothetical protein
MLDDLVECAPVFLAVPLVVFTADPPVHAPTAVAGAAFAEQVFKSRPEIVRERAYRKLHLVLFSLASVVQSCGVPPNAPAKPRRANAMPPVVEKRSFALLVKAYRFVNDMKVTGAH